MLIYAVNKQDYSKYRQSELEKISQKVKEISNNQVIVTAKFSKNGKDFSGVDTILYQLLKKQYESNNYIKQEDLNSIDKALEKIESRDLETLNSVLLEKSKNIKSIDNMVDIINQHKNYMLLYVTDEEELGRFIVKNLECYQMPQKTLDNLDSFIDYKEVARGYLYYSNITLVQIEDIILDISNMTDDELIKKLKEKQLDARTIYDNNKE